MRVPSSAHCSGAPPPTPTTTTQPKPNNPAARPGLRQNANRPRHPAPKNPARASPSHAGGAPRACTFYGSDTRQDMHSQPNTGRGPCVPVIPVLARAAVSERASPGGRATQGNNRDGQPLPAERAAATASRARARGPWGRAAQRDGSLLRVPACLLPRAASACPGAADDAWSMRPARPPLPCRRARVNLEVHGRAA